VIVTVKPMGMMQVAVDQVIEMVPVGNCLVATIRTVNMRFIMSRAGVAWRTSLRIHRVHAKVVVVNMIALRVMQVAVVKIVRMTIVSHSRMTTVRTMRVAVST
jgi:hypothetical protein